MSDKKATATRVRRFERQLKDNQLPRLNENTVQKDPACLQRPGSNVHHIASVAVELTEPSQLHSPLD
jgi:hypothetical protein